MLLSAEDLRAALAGETDSPAAPLSDVVETLASPAAGAEARALCAELLGNLARTEAFRTPLAAAGAIPPLVALASPDGPACAALGARAAAVRALANLCFDHDENRAAVAALPAAAPAVLALLRDACAASDSAAARVACGAVGNLSSGGAELAAALAPALAHLATCASGALGDAPAALALRAAANMACAGGEPEERARAAGLVAAAAHAVGSPARAEAVEALAAFFASDGAAAALEEATRAGAPEALAALAVDDLCEEGEPSGDAEEEEERMRAASESAAVLATLCASAEGAAAAAPVLAGLLRALCASRAPGPLRSDARRNVAEALAAACAHSEVAGAALAACPEELLSAAASHADPRARMFTLAALGSAATTPERALLVARKAGRAVLAQVREAADGDAAGLRALGTLQNLTVTAECRAELREGAVGECVAGALRRLRNPLMLFAAVVCARHLVGDGAGAARDLAAHAAVEALGELARSERGVPDPHSAQELDEEGAPTSAPPVPVEPEKRDLRVAYESARVAARIAALAPELAGSVVRCGAAAGWELMARSPYDLLVSEAEGAVTALRGEELCDLDARSLDELAKAAHAVAEVRPGCAAALDPLFQLVASKQ